MADTRLISIINEEVGGFLTEYADEDIIDTKNINLQQEYDRLNQQLFGDALPKIPLQWSNRKTSLGHVNSIRNRYTGEAKIRHLALTAFYKTPYRVFKDTLAHEMIHVKQISSGERGSHGWSFIREANRINGMGLGYHITETNTEKLDMSDRTKANMAGKGKTLIAMIFDIDGKYYLNVTTPNVYQAESDFIFNLMERLVNRGKYGSIEVTVVESQNPALLTYRISRSFKRGYTYSPLNDELLEQLLNEKIIKSIKIKRGVPMQVSEDIQSSNVAGAWEEEEIS